MKLEKRLKAYPQTIKISPKEQQIKETVKKAIIVFYASEQEKMLTYREFLWAQLRLIRKRWWLLQVLLLAMLRVVLPYLQSGQLSQRIMGIAASLFVIFVIPEFWKSQTYQSMEIEAASYYSLQQIYAARMLLFGVVDIALLTFFCGLSTVTLNVSFSQLLIQFILPMVVTTCICFGILCSKHPFSETAAVMLCIAWSTIWLFLVLNDKIYTAISFPLWMTFLGFALLLLVFFIYRSCYCFKNYWEVNINGIEIS